MDNIQKSIFAVLGLSAFVTMIIPTGDSFSPTPQQTTPQIEAVSPASAPPPSDPDVVVSDEYASQDGEVEAPDEFESFGQPMNDARPLGMSSDSPPQSESPQSNLPTNAFDNSNSNMAGSQAAPIYAGPTNAPIVTNQPVE